MSEKANWNRGGLQKRGGFVGLLLTSVDEDEDVHKCTVLTQSAQLFALFLSSFNLSDLGRLGVAPTNWSRQLPIRKSQFVITR